jgi:hypothetical protein
MSQKRAIVHNERQGKGDSVIRTLQPVLTQLKSEVRSSEVAAASWRVSA